MKGKESYMRIAVITGASSGMGRELVLQLDKKEKYDEIWVIARRADRLEELKNIVKNNTLRIVPMDLTDENQRAEYATMLVQERADVAFLANVSGFGRFGKYYDIPLSDCMDMIDLNVKALVAMTQLTLPFMQSGAQILQLDSLSSFQPVPYLNTYAATKAFVSSFSRGLNVELQPRGIRVMAVCPGWVKTEFFNTAEVLDPTAVTYFSSLWEARDVVKLAFKDYDAGKDVSILGASVRAQVLLTKLLPHKLVMKIWMRQQKHHKRPPVD